MNQYESKNDYKIESRLNIVEYNAATFGERLKELRLERGIGQNKLAEVLKISNASVSYWENEKQEPSASALFKLAQYFDVSVDYLLGLSN